MYSDPDREIIYEIIDTGRFLRVSAFDVETHTEVVTMTPRDFTQFQAQKLAYMKLLYVLNKKDLKSEDSGQSNFKDPKSFYA